MQPGAFTAVLPPCDASDTTVPRSPTSPPAIGRAHGGACVIVKAPVATAASTHGALVWTWTSSGSPKSKQTICCSQVVPDLGKVAMKMSPSRGCSAARKAGVASCARMARTRE
eukprot:scaffold209732_cov39-Tisochrysis_lutea.AAC.2